MSQRQRIKFCIADEEVSRTTGRIEVYIGGQSQVVLENYPVQELKDRMSGLVIAEEALRERKKGHQPAAK